MYGYLLSVVVAQSELEEALINNALKEKAGTGKNLPLFVSSKQLTRMNDMNSLLHWKVQTTARKHLLLVKRGAELEDLRQNFNPDLLFDRLYRNSTPWISPELLPGACSHDQLISFEGFQKVVQELSSYLLVQLWFTPKLFMKFALNEVGGRVSIFTLMEYAVKKLEYYMLRIQLYQLDDTGKGYITKKGLMLYICRKLETENRYWNTNGKDEYPLKIFYFESLASEIFFVLDPHRTNKIRIVELLDSRYLPNILDQFPALSENLLGNGERRQLLDTFLYRLVQIYGDPEIDKGKISFETYMDITFAFENLKYSFSSICYFFRVLDVDNKGYLDQMDLQFHYRNVQDYMEQKTGISIKEHEQQRFANFKGIQAQISDLLAGEGGLNHITPAKLFKVRNGHMLIEFLVDVAQSLETQDDYYQQASADSSFPDNDLKTTNNPNHSSSPTISTESLAENNLMNLSTPPPSISLKNEEGQGDVPLVSGLVGV
ncbi:Serine/threonine-protein phosphatase 2A regulatory subunit B'' subunit gamma [Orchesella cincta]|uniref:Serine/threonine-protein phosphatase 2A regulatory subunit B'' subunit gamma n=1 Tax=Orchesella cincta TaxID=48709 RepID=A0A1D2NEX2_ORCCI|nr:Serine/threonine-protein phosphatase 2A regulatory subunit B'' subunit gamma [Orchesella cincta]